MAKQIYTAEAVEDFNGSNESYTFTGEWENGKPNGYGIKIYPDGTINRGFFKDGMLQGYAVCHYADGVTFEGHFVNDEKNGYGVEIGKIIYRGFFKDGKYHGKGMLNYPNKIDYVGDFGGENLFHGVGMLEHYHLSVAAYYVGQIRDGKQEGYGKLIYGNGIFYEGEWKNNNYHGKGAFYYPDKGYKFECTFVNGKEHGKSRVVSLVDGRVLKEEQWSNGNRI